MLREFAIGFATTFKHIFKKPITVNYPDQKVPMFPKYRGKQVLMRDENGLEKCVACGLCAVACPADAIYLEAAENDGSVQAGPRYASVYQIHKTRCIFCGYCEEACPVSAIFMGKDYELAIYSKDDFIWDKADLLVPAATAPVRRGEVGAPPGRLARRSKDLQVSARSAVGMRSRLLEIPPDLDDGRRITDAVWGARRRAREFRGDAPRDDLPSRLPFWLCVGDLASRAGVYPEPPVPLYWIKGNNENFEEVTAMASGSRVIANLHYIANGTAARVGPITVAGLGGTYAPTWYHFHPADLPYPGHVDEGGRGHRPHDPQRQAPPLRARRGRMPCCGARASTSC